MKVSPEIQLRRALGRVKGAWADLANAEANLERVRARVGKQCPHPEPYHKSYLWEHDDGYGRQRMVSGIRCDLCGATRPWASMSHWVDRPTKKKV